MGWPRSNNLKSHLQWAQETNAFKPIIESNSSLPTPPSQPEAQLEEVELSSDSDLEFLALISKPNAPQYIISSSPPPKSPRKPHAQDSLPLPAQPTQSTRSEPPVPAPQPAPQPILQSEPRSAPQSVKDPHVLAASRVSHTLQAPQTSQTPQAHQLPQEPQAPQTPQTPKTSLSKPFTYSQSQVTPQAPSKPEIGSLLSEKIALLERKIGILQSTLKSHSIPCNTADVDNNLKDVEQRIDRFAEEDDEVIDILSSPSLFAQSSPSQFRGLPEIENDAFDSLDDFEVAEVKTLNPNFARSPQSDRPPTTSYPPDGRNIDESDSMEEEMIHTDDVIVSEQVPQPTQTVPQPAHPWSKELMHTLRTRFGLNGFRANQAEAVNETLNGNDVVVLMPTGGGKSLCYQLPALIRGGKTIGTTLVISPLISLMQDQVYHLKNRNIQAEMLNSRLNVGERNEVFSKLRGGTLQLLYLSPEMLSASGMMKSSLQQLYSNGRLARIVIDEAHCVSSWGHDFRPEYMELTRVKFDFPNTPIMALTATANERVLLDIVNCLRPNPKVLRQSFNRQNLYYEVRQKTTSVIQDIAGICRQFPGKSGIVYCNSKKNCEETAGKLCDLGVRASFYHAGLDQDLRAKIQTEWQQGISQVVCATIAFGMGIDKPDVRYVVHLTLPRNVEGYYQETGRAGRDGKPSRCVLFYTYRDVQLLQKMIYQDKHLNPAIREHHKSLLIRVMQYCENSTDCRRKQVLQYFNEDFDPKLCRMQCDNCRKMKGQVAVRKDMTSQTRQIVNIVQEISSNSITTQQLIDILLGRTSAKVKSCGFNNFQWFGSQRLLGLTVVERLVHSLLSERVLEEYSQYNKSRYPQTYVRLGPNSMNVIRGSMAIQLVMPNENEPHAESRDSAGKRPSRSRSTFKQKKRARYSP